MSQFLLPPNYYLSNFKILCDTVSVRYSDILPHQDTSFLDKFNLLPESAQKLFVRLVCRAPEYFLAHKIKYDGIENIEQTLIDLEKTNLVSLDPPTEFNTWSELLTKQDWLSLNYGNISIQLKSSDRKEQILKTIEPLWTQISAPNLATVQVFFKDTIERFQMLFFENAHQSLTEFVLNDLGIRQYESYSLDKTFRKFHSEQEILQYQEISKIRRQLQSFIEAGELEKLANSLLKIETTDSNQQSFQKATNELARLLEKSNTQLAIALYKKAKVHPARERLSRIFEQSGNIEQAWHLAQTAFDNPQSAEELRDCQALIKRLNKKAIKQDITTRSITWPTQHSWPERNFQLSGRPLNIEQCAEQLYHKQFDWIEHTENALFCAVFALAYWEVIFSPYEGAFSHPFQSRPHDLYESDFLEKREASMKECLDELNGEQWKSKILTCYQLKQGVENALFNWNSISLLLIQQAMEIIPQSHWLTIWQRMWQDLRQYRSGFPDLLALNTETKHYRLIEVKGPGDRLQKNQIGWLSYFSEHGIPVEVAHIEIV